MNKKSKTRWVQAKELFKTALETERVVVVLPRVSSKYRADIMFIGAGKKVERFEFPRLPGFKGWVASKDENKRGYFYNRHDSWDVFVAKLFQYFGASVPKKIYVMSEQKWLDEWDRIVNAA